MDAYIAVKAHYIAVSADSWKLEDDLIGFRLLKGSHSGKRLAKVMFDICEDMKIVGKVRLAFITSRRLTNGRIRLDGLRPITRPTTIRYSPSLGN